MTTTKPPAVARAPTAPRPVYPDGLTYAQVADQLVLSSRTMQEHLRSIYNKINVKSRSAATEYAVEHKIV